MRQNVVMVSGSSVPELSAEVAEFLGIELSSLSTGRFADGESSVQIGDNVRGKDVFVLQSLVGTENGGTINDAIIELLLTISPADELVLSGSRLLSRTSLTRDSRARLRPLLALRSLQGILPKCCIRWAWIECLHVDHTPLRLWAAFQTLST